MGAGPVAGPAVGGVEDPGVGGVGGVGGARRCRGSGEGPTLRAEGCRGGFPVVGFFAAGFLAAGFFGVSRSLQNDSGPASVGRTIRGPEIESGGDSLTHEEGSGGTPVKVLLSPFSVVFSGLEAHDDE